MRSVWGRRLADGLLILTFALMVVAAFLDQTAPERVSVDPSWGSTGLLGAALLLVPGAAFVAVGWLIATRQPGNRIGWMCLAIGLLWTVLMSAGSLGHWIFQKRGPGDELGLWILWVGDWLYATPLGLIGTHLLLRLPDGRLLSQGWRYFSRFSTAVIASFSLALAVEVDTVSGIAGTTNPSLHYLEWARVLEPVAILFPLSFVGAIACLVMRYRRSNNEIRHQIQWIALGGLSFVGSFIVVLAILQLGSVDTASFEGQVLTNITLVGYSLVPISIGFSVLKYRLYDIDVIVNRALVYGLLTTMLGIAYLIIVALMQQLFRPLTGTSDLSIAISTLAVAALFGPLRARLQTFIDSRFYRSKYDATQTVEAFSARLRDEVDIDTLTKDLLAVVQDSMQPRSVSLWLRASSDSAATSAHG
jgi:small basic protein